MQDILQQILEIARGSWRFRRYALVAAWLVAILGWLAVFAMPDQYQASSRVFVDTRTAVKSATAGLTLDADVGAQLNLVRQSLLSHPQLEPVAAEVGLVDRRTMNPQQTVAAMAMMRERIQLAVTNAGENPNDREAGNIYSIRYSDPSRERALRVVQILQTNLIENTLGGKKEGSEGAQKFLETQIAELEKRLRTAEDSLAAFKKQNVGLMPAESGGYFSRLQLEIDAVTKAQTALSVASSRREELSRQLRGDTPIAAASGISPSPQGGQGGAGDTMARIKETQARLDELLLRFTDKHPDVISARENLAQLKARRSVEIEALRRGDPGAIAASGVGANPVYQSIQLALNQTDVEIAQLRRELSGHQAKVAELRGSLDTMPQVEAEYARLNRDYDVTKANYTALVERLEKSRLGEEASTSGSVRFNVVEPPNADFNPISPQRALLVLAVLMGAIGVGAAVAFLMHQLRPVFTSVKGLAESTGLTVLGSVSMAWLDHQNNSRRSSYIRYAVAVAGLLVLGAVVLQLNRMGIRLPMKGS